MKSHQLFLFALALNLSLFFVANAASIENGFIKQNAYETDHFRVEFSNLILDQVDDDGNGLPDVVDTIAEAAEYSRDVVIGDLDYPDPMSGYDRKIIIVLDDREEYLSAGAMGVTSLLSNGDPFISVDPWLSSDDLEVTVGHEYFHCVQFGYDPDFAYYDQGANWAEATAVWAEDVEYDDNNDYLYYLPEYFDYVDYSVFASVVPSGTLYQYGLAIWPRFLSEYFNADVIQDVWESYFDSNNSYDDDRKLYNAVNEVIEAQDENLRTVYRDFTLWNLDLSEYEEGDGYPLVYTLEGQVDSDYQEIDQDFAPALFGTNYLYFDNASNDSSFYFHLVKPEGVSFAVTLVPYDDGSVSLSEKEALILERDESMDEVLELGGLHGSDGVYAIVSALDTSLSGDHVDDFDYGYLYNYFAQYDDAGANYDSVISSSSSSSTETSTDEKSGTSASEASVPLSDHLTLTIVNYNQDSVSFSWNRLTDSDIDSYELHYGTSSGDYTNTAAVNHAYITAKTVDDLDEGEKYYFELVALDSDGDEVGDPSGEVSVTLAEWLFTDVSYLDEHYDSIAALTEAGVFSGYANGSFKPNDTINRAELLKILVEGRGIDPSVSTYKNCFEDVGTEWYAKYVCYAKNKGWVQGYDDGTFKPGDPVNKVEALKILFQVYEAGLDDGAASAALAYDDLFQTAWYATYVEAASDLGILEESIAEEFDPSASRTRGEMAEELYRYLVASDLME